MKMLLIGLSKLAGAKIYHRAIKDYSFGQIVRSVMGEVLARCSIAAGIAVKNGYDQTSRIVAITSEQFAEQEKVLLTQAKEWSAKLPFETADILLIDEIGKNISGTGFDLSIVGRRHHAHKAAGEEYPKIRMIALRDLTVGSHGNAEGIGLAEFCLSRLIKKMDLKTTRVNSLTSGHFTGSMIPIEFKTDTELLEAMLAQIGLTNPPNAKLLWIRNTLSLGQVECSAAYLDEARGRDDLELLSGLRPLPFDANGNLPDEHMLHSI